MSVGVNRRLLGKGEGRARAGRRGIEGGEATRFRAAGAAQSRKGISPSGRRCGSQWLGGVD